ncbi:hypothetical protein BH18CHL1_BH18CHL1_05720 [soil metagenome]
MRLVEIRMLDGPNTYRLEPAVKLEIVVGRRRTWYGQREPGRHSVVRLGAPIPAARAAAPARDVAAWVRRLHALTGSAAWLVGEGRASTVGRARIPVTIHRTSEPGHWIVAYPWRERQRAESIGEAAYRLVELGLDAGNTRPAHSRGQRGSRTMGRALARIREAATDAPDWIRDQDRRMPAVSISGTNGKSTTTRMITHILLTAGRRVGSTTSDGVLVDGVLVVEGDLTGPMGAQQVLRDESLDVAVLETARGGLVLRGMGYESNEASVLTNVSSDHLDLMGLHTLPELAEVKSIVARITRSDGVAVLNADDPLVAAVARRVRARVCLFSLSPTNRRVRSAVARGGLGLVLDDGWLVELEGDRTHRVVRAADVPATVGGLAKHNVSNALAAAGAARALGVSIAKVADGLRDFRPSAEQAPGRLNLYRVGKRLVIVDFAHNEAGLSVVLDLVEGLVGPRKTRRTPVVAIIGTAGDRPDDSLRGIGRIAAERADEVALKETQRYLRGRSRESVLGELRAGVAAGGGDAVGLAAHEDEATALRAALTEEGRLAATGSPAVVLLMCQADRQSVITAIGALGGEPVGDVSWFETA